jgi:hypothetical protein
MAAGYTLEELVEYMGHADLQMVNRYVKLLPQPGERDAAQRLDDYLRRGRVRASGGSMSGCAWRANQRSISATVISTSWPQRITFSSGWTLRSKWLMLMPSEVAASRRVSVKRGTGAAGRRDARGISRALPAGRDPWCDRLRQRQHRSW